jgi:hypothetical protein
MKDIFEMGLEKIYHGQVWSEFMLFRIQSSGRVTGIRLFYFRGT